MLIFYDKDGLVTEGEVVALDRLMKDGKLRDGQHLTEAQLVYLCGGVSPATDDSPHDPS